MVGSSNARIGSVEIVSWGGGSYKQISKMLDAHYKGTIDISDYWEVGDTREELLYDVIGGYIYSETIKFVIIGMNHDDLVRPINGITKAAVTVHWLEPFSIKFNNAMYEEMRESLNIGVFNSLPEELSAMIKYVSKITNKYIKDSSSDYSIQILTTDKVFNLSIWEIFNENIITSDVVGSTGTQYEYFQTENNRIKYVNGVAVNAYFVRESYPQSSVNEVVSVYFKSTGSPNINSNPASAYLCPAFCL